MTSPSDVTWKLVVKGLKGKLAGDRRASIAAALNSAFGEAISVRTARRSLLTISVEALAGKPKLIDVHGDGEVCLMAIDDLLEILADPPPTLAEIMASSLR